MRIRRTLFTNPSNKIKKQGSLFALNIVFFSQIFLKEAPEVKKLIDLSLVDSDSSIVLHTFRLKFYLQNNFRTKFLRSVCTHFNVSFVCYRFIKTFVRHLTELAEKEMGGR
jgi:hypothetical protein